MEQVVKVVLVGIIITNSVSVTYQPTPSRKHDLGLDPYKSNGALHSKGNERVDGDEVSILLRLK